MTCRTGSGVCETSGTKYTEALAVSATVVATPDLPWHLHVQGSVLYTDGRLQLCGVKTFEWIETQSLGSRKHEERVVLEATLCKSRESRVQSQGITRDCDRNRSTNVVAKLLADRDVDRRLG